MYSKTKERTYLVRHYPNAHRGLDPKTSETQNPVVTRMTIAQWQSQHPGTDVRNYLVSNQLDADYDDAVDFAHEIAEASGLEWDAREDLKPEVIEYLMETVSHLNRTDKAARESYLKIQNLTQELRSRGFCINDIAAHYSS